MAGIFLGVSAAGWAAIGTATAIAGSAASFSQASASKNERRKAEAAAKNKMNAAREKLKVNYMESLSIPMEAYEREREALLVQGATAMQAATEGDQRGAGAVAGRVLQAQQEGQAEQRTAMAKDIFNLEAATAEESSRLRDVGVGLDLQEAEGAQMSAAAAEARRNAAISQGVQGITSAVQQTISAAPLYGKSQALKGISAIQKSNPELQSQIAAQYGKTTIGTGDAAQVKNIADLTPNEFNDYLLTNFTLEDLQGFGTTSPAQQGSGFQYTPVRMPSSTGTLNAGTQVQGINPFNYTW